MAGYEWLDFSQFVHDDDVELPVEEPDLRFDVEGEEVRGPALKELAQWAYQRFVVPTRATALTIGGE